MEKITKSSDKVLIDPNEPLILPDGTALVGRVEWFLYALCCLDYQNLPTPMSRIEEFANALITGEVPNIEPQSRAEQFFLAILDGNVSDLPQPQSRSEVLLDKLARGEFDLSDVEPIQSRYELLLAYLIKNGGIGNIDYVLYEFSEEMKTMYNTVEKPFKSLELNGNTKVNVLQESVEDDVIVPYQVDECQGATLTGTKETGSLDNLVINGRTLVNSVLEDTSNSDYVSFDQDYEGQSFTINGTNEGAIKSAILSGNTLVNLCDKTKSVFSADGNKNLWQNALFNTNPTQLTIINYTDKVIKFTLHNRTTDAWVSTNKVNANSKLLVNCGTNNYLKDLYGAYSDGWNNAEEDRNILKDGILILEGDHTQEDIPYFEGMQSVKNSQTLVNVVSSCEFGGDSMLYESRFYERPFNTGETFTIFVVNPNVTTIKVGLHNATDDVWQGEIEYNVSDNKKIVYTVPTGNTLCKYVGVRVNTELDSTGFENSLVIMSGDKSNLEIENYFEGMQSVKMPMLTTTGKNLIDNISWESGRFDNNTGLELTDNSFMRYQKFIPVKPSTTYVLSNGLTDYKAIYEYDTQKTFIGLYQNTSFPNHSVKFTTSSTTRYIRIWTKNTTISPTFQLEESSTTTTYEPYKSNILTVNEDLELRGIDDVKDELNLMTGELTQRIGEVVLDGKINISWQVKNIDSNECIYFGIPNYGDIITSKGYSCDNFKFITGGINATFSDDTEFITNKYWTGDGCGLAFSIKKSKLESLDSNGFNNYLRNAPTTIHYHTKQESIKTVDLNVVDQNNTKIDKIHVFDEVTHVNTSSDELTPTVNIGKSVSYPTIIKPNTKYTVDLKRNDKPLTVNLGGTEVTFASGETRKIITTPSKLTNDKLSYYGIGQKCSDIMVLEGEVEENVDYFTGMQSVKVLTVSTVGKNVVNEKIWKIEAEEEGYQCLLSAGYATEAGKSGNPIIIPVHVEKGKVYTLKCKNKATEHFNDFYFMDDLLNGNVKSFRKSVGKNTTLNSFVDTIITFTADRDYKYLQIDTGNGNANGYIVKNTLQLEEGSIATPYEPYKSTILSCDEDVELYSSPNGVYKDYINIPTHKLFKTNNVVTVNGSENWTMYSLNDEYPNTVGFYYTHNNSLNSVEGELQLLVDGGILKWFENERFPGNINTSEEGIGLIDNKYIKVSVLKSRLETVDVNGFKKWLTNNPITVQYVTNPTVKTINISIIDQDNVVQSKLHTFNDTTHIMTSSDELTPIIKCDGKLEYPVVIKPSTQYTILANTSANGHALNNIAFDLGGEKVTNTFGTRKITITTPSTLTDNSLTITGEGAKVSELMVLEGNESDTLPYFEGMSSCKMPILHTNGKNLLPYNEMFVSPFTSATPYITKNVATFPFTLGVNGRGVGIKFKVEPNTTYTLSSNVVIPNTAVGVAFYKNESDTTNHNNKLGIAFSTNIEESTKTFTTPNECNWIVCGMYILYTYEQSGGTVVISEMPKLQLEKNTQATTYEPHKSSILSCNDDVTLCGIGEVKDELNPLTSELTQHIKEFVLNGSESGWFKSSNVTSDGGYRYALRLNDGIVKDHAKIMCDKFVQSENAKIGYVNYLVIDNGLKSALYFNSTAETVDEWKAWLVENNVKVQYQLATESIRTVDLNVVDQDGNIIPKIKSYKDVTHLEITVPKQSLLPHISAEVATDNSKDMSSLTTKHQEISETQSAIEDNIQSQSDEIDTALMATTEIFESILE